MRGLAILSALLLLLIGGCASAAQQTAPKQTAKSARLILASLTPERTATRLQAIDPDTLADDASLEPRELSRCASSLVVQPGGKLAVAVSGAATWSRQCADAPSAAVNLLDLQAWTWHTPLQLPSDVTLGVW